MGTMPLLYSTPFQTISFSETFSKLETKNAGIASLCVFSHLTFNTIFTLFTRAQRHPYPHSSFHSSRCWVGHTEMLPITEPGTSHRGPTSKNTLFPLDKNKKKTFASNSCARPCSTRVGWGRLACGLVAVPDVGAGRSWKKIGGGPDGSGPGGSGPGGAVRVGAVQVGAVGWRWSWKKSGSGLGEGGLGRGQFRAFCFLSRPFFFQFPKSFVELRCLHAFSSLKMFSQLTFEVLWIPCEAAGARLKRLGF